MVITSASAPLMTWWLVTINPSFETKNPVPLQAGSGDLPTPFEFLSAIASPASIPKAGDLQSASSIWASLWSVVAAWFLVPQPAAEPELRSRPCLLLLLNQVVDDR